MLMNRIVRKIKDKALMQLIGRYLRAGIAETETDLWFPSEKGVPQGDPLAPLLTFQRGRVQIHAKTLKTFKGKVRTLTNRNWGVTMSKQIHKLNQFIRGWGNYFLIANAYQLTVDLDNWLRRRSRMCYWRQWRKPRTKVRVLMRLGVSERLATSCGITSKGPCRSSKTQGINLAISNAFLERQGLVSVRDVD